MSKLVGIGQVVLEKKSKMEEVNRPIDRQTDRRLEMLEFSVLVSKKIFKEGVGEE